jgi:FMN phosphatase YigB (HAD superfamily)
MKIIIFDVDETLGSFYPFFKYCASMVDLNKLTFPVFKYLLDINPQYLQPNIIIILTYIKLKKTKNCKVAMFTNNEGDPIWIKYIQLYFNTVLNYELFDTIVYSSKYEPKRKHISKSIDDFWECTGYPKTSSVLFIDDQLHPLMLSINVTYLHIAPYSMNTQQDISKWIINHIQSFLSS